MGKIKLVVPCLFLGLVAMTFCSPSSRAALLHDNGAWNGTASGSTSINGPTEQDVAENFTPTNHWSVNAATWVGLWRDGTVSSPSRSFIIEIFSDASGQPSTTPIFMDTVTATGTLLSSAPMGNVSVDVFSFAANFNLTANLNAGQTYYFSTTDAGPGASGLTGMFWTASFASSDGTWDRPDDAGVWTTGAGERAFTLSGAVNISMPEPGTLAILAVGLVGLGIARRKRAA